MHFFKFSIILILLSGAVNSTHWLQAVEKDNELLEAIVGEIFKCLKTVLKNGISELEFNSVDPIEIGDVPIVLNDIQLNGNFNFFKMVLKGLSDFELQSIKMVEDTVEYAIYSNVTLRGGYEFLGRVLDIADIFGNGNLDLNVGLKFTGDLVVDLGSDGIEIKKFKIITTIFPNIKITGLQGDENISALIGKQIDSILDEIINSNKDPISTILSPIVKYFLDKLTNITSSPELGAVLQLIIQTCYP